MCQPNWITKGKSYWTIISLYTNIEKLYLVVFKVRLLFCFGRQTTMKFSVSIFFFRSLLCPKEKKIPCILDPHWLCLLSPLVDYGKCLSLCIIPCIVRCLQLHVLVICDLCLSDDYIAFGYGQNFKDIAVMDQFCNKPWFMKINRNGSFLKIDFWGHYLI